MCTMFPSQVVPWPGHQSEWRRGWHVHAQSHRHGSVCCRLSEGSLLRQKHLRVPQGECVFVPFGCRGRRIRWSLQWQEPVWNAQPLNAWLRVQEEKTHTKGRHYAFGAPWMDDVIGPPSCKLLQKHAGVFLRGILCSTTWGALIILTSGVPYTRGPQELFRFFPHLPWPYIHNYLKDYLCFWAPLKASPQCNKQLCWIVRCRKKKLRTL